MKNRGMSGINLLVSMVAGIIFLFVIIAITTKGTFAFENGTFGFLGNCQEKCEKGEFKVSDKCKEDGKIQNGMSRCFEIADLWTADNDKDDNNEIINNTISSGGEVLEARLGIDPLRKYMRSTPRKIDANSGPWKFSVWGAKGTAYFCEVRFFEKDSNDNPIPIPDGNFLQGKDVPDKVCVDPRPEVHKNNEEYRRANIINMELAPKDSDVGTYEILLILRDKQKKAVASERLSLKVNAEKNVVVNADGSSSLTECPYADCYEITNLQGSNGDKQYNCDVVANSNVCNLNCEWRFSANSAGCFKKFASQITQTQCAFLSCNDINLQGSDADKQYNCDVVANSNVCNLNCEWKFDATSAQCQDKLNFG